MNKYKEKMRAAVDALYYTITTAMGLSFSSYFVYRRSSCYGD